MFKKILFATDDSPQSKKAIDYVIDIAKKYNAEVVILNAYYLPEHFNGHESGHYIYLQKIEENMIKHSKDILEKLKQQFEEKEINVKTILEKGAIGLSIVNKATSEECDLVIVGTRGLGNISSMLISSISNYVIHHAKCPVLLVQ